MSSGRPIRPTGSFSAAATGALVTLPARLAAAFAAGFGLVTAHPPLAIRRFPVSVLWRRGDERDPRLGWLRRQLREVVAGLPAVEHGAAMA